MSIQISPTFKALESPAVPKAGPSATPDTPQEKPRTVQVAIGAEPKQTLTYTEKGKAETSTVDIRRSSTVNRIY